MTESTSNPSTPADAPIEVLGDGPLHDWFELSYAQFLTVPRLVLCSMSIEWQRKMAALLREMDETFDWKPDEGCYWVKLRDSQGRFSDAPPNNYRHGNIDHLRIKREKQYEQLSRY